MSKRLVAAGLAVWLGLICLPNLPGLEPAPDAAPAAAPGTVAFTEIAPVQPALPTEYIPTDKMTPSPDAAPAPAPVDPARSGAAPAKTPQTTAPPAKSPSRGGAVNPSPGLAGEMLSLLNAERANNGLPALILDKRLSDGAYLKSKDMGINGYFSHTSPTYGSPFQMMKSRGITYRVAAENIARNRSVSAAHTAFMNSAGHRANILDASFRKVGLGFYQQGKDLYVTQWFTN